ncbi:uncharacterized protein LOC107270051 [Cephus cinctus]|uniref:Uncharacterized protein LOC107270051 n=1 Tax=Cephus cinctus TaxID=211228 RepID=A0AAJ7FN77_CEPCN|nr:uncharacterized protein LOC107270051 [Cephus cinctus]
MEINAKYLIASSNNPITLKTPLRISDSRYGNNGDVSSNTSYSNDPGGRGLRNLPQTPAKKRSSLARPVRVHDSFSHNQPKFMNNYSQQPNECAYNHFNGTETAWPMRLRLEEMLELTLPQSKRNKHSFKDTERLLKVFSINNVDQDRYNVKRCSIM